MTASAHQLDPGRSHRPSLLAGAAAAVLLLVAGVLLAVTSSQHWTAETSIVLLPGPTLDPAQEASYYETLSRGQVAATFAEVVSNRRFQREAQDQLGLTTGQRGSTSVAVTVVPTTSVVLVSVTATTARTAERTADTTARLAGAYYASLAQPFRAERVQGADGDAVRSGVSALLIVLASLVAALIGGIVVQQATHHLLGLRSRQQDPTGPPVLAEVRAEERARPLTG